MTAEAYLALRKLQTWVDVFSINALEEGAAFLHGRLLFPDFELVEEQ